jgi:hypothetical protein
MNTVWAEASLPVACVVAAAGVILIVLSFVARARAKQSDYINMDADVSHAMTSRAPLVLLVVGAILVLLGLAGVATIVAISLTSAPAAVGAGASRAAIVSNSITVPAGATVVSDLDTTGAWAAAGATGAAAIAVSTPSVDGVAREMSFPFTATGGDARMSSQFGTDAAATDYVVDF